MLAELEPIEEGVIPRMNLQESIGEMRIEDSNLSGRESSDGSVSVKRKSDLEIPAAKKMARRGVKRGREASSERSDLAEYVKGDKRKKVNISKLGLLSAFCY